MCCCCLSLCCSAVLWNLKCAVYGHTLSRKPGTFRLCAISPIPVWGFWSSLLSVNLSVSLSHFYFFGWVCAANSNYFFVSLSVFFILRITTPNGMLKKNGTKNIKADQHNSNYSNEHLMKTISFHSNDHIQSLTAFSKALYVPWNIIQQTKAEQVSSVGILGAKQSTSISPHEMLNTTPKPRQESFTTAQRLKYISSDMPGIILWRKSLSSNLTTVTISSNLLKLIYRHIRWFLDHSKAPPQHLLVFL